MNAQTCKRALTGTSRLTSGEWPDDELALAKIGCFTAPKANKRYGPGMFSAFKGADLQHKVGLEADARSWRSDGAEGALCYGPYIKLPVGLYTVALRLLNNAAKRVGGRFNVELCYGCGVTNIVQQEIQMEKILAVPTRIYIDFDLNNQVSDLEIRIHVWVKTFVTLLDLTVYDRVE